ncbi:MAG: SoxR reducing system RseC family protein [Saprospiraceae bacterium]|nr:SoxR reducing system RseC family protein [Saprospiraceae bacterium]
MTTQKDNIEHSGIITKIDDSTIYISIIAESACVSCSAKGMCNVSDMKEKIIEVSNHNYDYKVGEKVTVVLEKSLGMKAVFYGYFLPLIIVVTSLIILTATSVNEGLAALVSIGLLIPYYIALNFNKDKLKKKFEFRIK